MDWSTISPVVVIATCSLITACCSLFVALVNFRRSNHVVLAVLDSASSGGVEHSRGQYHEFRVVVRNLGVPLHDIGMVLRFRAADGFGSFSSPLKLKDGKTIREGQFFKGTTTEFTFATDKMKDGDPAFIGMVSDLKAQRVELIIHSDKYAVWSYPLHDRLWWLKKRWNRMAAWASWKCLREVTTSHGTKGLKPAHPLLDIREFKSAGNDMLRFAAVMRQTPSQPRRPMPTWPHPCVRSNGAGTATDVNDSPDGG